MDDSELLSTFIGSFASYDEMTAFEEVQPEAWDLRLGKPGRFGAKWLPKPVETDASALQTIYAAIPLRFPSLFERLILSYRWAEVDLGSFRLLANPRGPGLAKLSEKILKDKGLTESLIPGGFLQFGKGPGLNYDPVCFDTFRSRGSKEAPVVQLDHEDILCHRKLTIVRELASSFRALVENTIEQAKNRGSAG